MPTLPVWVHTAWRVIVVVLIVVHLVAITLMAFPSPGGGLNRKDWSQPTVQAEFDAWNERLRAVGWTGSVDELQDRVYGFAKGYASGHRSLMKPFQSYYSYAGTHQSWRMFVAPHRYPSRLQIRVKEGRRWRVVYEARDPEHRWNAHIFDHDRMRSALFRYGWGRKYMRDWAAFGAWVAVQAATDFPDASVVELRFSTFRTLTPDEVKAGTEPELRWHKARKYPLDRYR